MSENQVRIQCKDTAWSDAEIVIEMSDYKGDPVWFLDIDDMRGRGRAFLTDDQLADLGAKVLGLLATRRSAPTGPGAG